MKVGDKVRVTRLDFGDILIKGLGIGYKLEVGMIGIIDNIQEEGIFIVKFDEQMVDDGAYIDGADVHCVVVAINQLELVTAINQLELVTAINQLELVTE